MFSFERCCADPVSAVGVPAEVLEHIFTKYCGKGTPIPRRQKLMRFFWVCKQYPTVRVMEEHFGVRYRHAFTQWRTCLDHLSRVMDEFAPIHQQRDFDHNQMFDIVVGIIDIVNTRLCVNNFPVYLQVRLAL